MVKTTPIRSVRAYVNANASYPEAAQRADILKWFGEPAEWYVESVAVTRADFIKHLRAGDVAAVADIGCLAKAKGRIDVRMADLLEARGDIHAKGATIEDGVGFTSKAWDDAKGAAKSFLLAQRSVKNGSKRKYMLTDTQVKRVLEIRDSKRYTNDNQRLAALKKEGIVIGRTYMVTMVPIIARERGIAL